MIRFPSPSLGEGQTRERRSKALAILAAALEAVDPEEAIRDQVSLTDDTLRVGERAYDLSHYRRIIVVGGGKAGASMAKAIEEILGPRTVAGLVNVKYGHTADTRVLKVNEAGHPIPDEAGLDGARRIAELAKGAGEGDLVLCLISGGGSALLPLPSEGITLADLQTLNDALLRCGATINEINAVRKHLSRIKGGGLAHLAYPAELVSLILSDVVGNPLDVIASGPTVADASTFAQACSVIKKYGLWGKIPPSVAERLQQGRDGLVPETPKAGDPIFARTYNLVVGSNEIAARAAIVRARELGFNTLLLSTFVEGEAREVGRVFAAVAKEIAYSGQPVPRPACVVTGGETTVTLRGQGKGGRNQELALAAALEIAGLKGAMIIGLATDGTDGPTDAAGALADGTTIERAQARGLDAARYLADNDSYHFFEALGDLIVTGPTNTNVHDLTFVFVF
jgi:glycerate 2-kinase